MSEKSLLLYWSWLACHKFGGFEIRFGTGFMEQSFSVSCTGRLLVSARFDQDKLVVVQLKSFGVFIGLNSREQELDEDF